VIIIIVNVVDALFIYLFIVYSFNDVVSSSDYIVSNGWMIN
jgi:hypothetical protein